MANDKACVVAFHLAVLEAIELSRKHGCHEVTLYQTGVGEYGSVNTRYVPPGAKIVCRISAVVTGTPHMVVQPSAIVTLAGSRAVDAFDKPVSAQTGAADQKMIISPAPFLIQYYGSTNVSSADEPVPAQSTHDRHGLVGPGIDVDDCYFRMFAVPEVQATMAFPGSYVVRGTKGKQIKQLGNAVTPPAMKLLIGRVVQFLTGERRIRVRAA